jgi:1-acyl-sn-glycerol-3-phosphate acyltransferase
MTEALLPRRSPTLIALFARYLRRWYFPRHFSAVRLSGTMPQLAPGRPAVVYSNHPGWWDPLIYVLLATGPLSERIGYGPMDAKSLAQFRFFEKLGVFPIELDSRRGAARFLRVASEILRDPANCLWITAEGGFVDPRRRPIRLKPGLAHLARRFPETTILPLAIEYPFWNEPKPEALIRFGAPVRDGGFEAALEATMDSLAEAAMTRDAANFETLLQGRGGIAGTYDLWRRLRAQKTRPL